MRLTQSAIRTHLSETQAFDMTEPKDSAEPLQILPAGLPRRYAEYRPAGAAALAAPPTNVGGYDELVAYFQTTGKPWYGFSERSAERGYEQLDEQKLIRQHPTFERDRISPINVRPVVYRAVNEPFDTHTKLKRQGKASRAIRKKNGSAGTQVAPESAPALGSKGAALPQNRRRTRES
jgi:hypothetical protein